MTGAVIHLEERGTLLGAHRGSVRSPRDKSYVCHGHVFPKAIQLVGKGLISIQDVHPQRYFYP
jgi:hypothetical protein